MCYVVTGEKRILNDKVRELNKLVSHLKEEKGYLEAQLGESRDQIAELSAWKSHLHCDNRSLKKEITSTIKIS